MSGTVSCSKDRAEVLIIYVFAIVGVRLVGRGDDHSLPWVEQSWRIRTSIVSREKQAVPDEICHIHLDHLAISDEAVIRDFEIHTHI